MTRFAYYVDILLHGFHICIMYQSSYKGLFIIAESLSAYPSVLNLCHFILLKS